MKFVIIDTKYLNYLRQYEKHIYYSEGEKENRKFVGVLLNVSGFDYYALLTSKVNNNYSTDFHIYDKNIKIAEIKINNMIPVLDNSLVKEFDYKINGDETIEEMKYKILLKKEMKYINNNIDRLNKLVNKIYAGKMKNPTVFDFKMLEEKAKEYKV